MNRPRRLLAGALSFQHSALQCQGICAAVSHTLFTSTFSYWSRHKPTVESQYPEETLSAWAREQGKPVHYEMPSQLDFAGFMAAMPDAAQSQYITFLLDFLDDQSAGRNVGEYGWI